MVKIAYVGATPSLAIERSLPQMVTESKIHADPLQR